MLRLMHRKSAASQKDNVWEMVGPMAGLDGRGWFSRWILVFSSVSLLPEMPPCRSWFDLDKGGFLGPKCPLHGQNQRRKARLWKRRCHHGRHSRGIWLAVLVSPFAGAVVKAALARLSLSSNRRESSYIIRFVYWFIGRLWHFWLFVFIPTPPRTIPKLSQNHPNIIPTLS